MSRLLAALKSTKQCIVFRDGGICANARHYVQKMTENLGDGLCQEACDYAEHQMRMLMRRWPKRADEYGNFPIDGLNTNCGQPRTSCGQTRYVSNC